MRLRSNFLFAKTQLDGLLKIIFASSAGAEIPGAEDNSVRLRKMSMTMS